MIVIAYVDETGDTGDTGKKGSSSCYALGCVLIELEQWHAAFEQLIEFRRAVRRSFNIPMRAELKANYLIRNGGGLRKYNLAPSQRSYIYRSHLRLLAELDAKAFAVVTDKTSTGFVGRTCFEKTWEMLLQRLDRMTQKENKTVVIAHDSGENDAVRRHVRKARRHLTAGALGGGGTYTFAEDRILEDPIPRDSQHSYLIQMADLVAYAGWRSYMPPSSAVAAVAPQDMWQQLGTAINTKVNSLSPKGSVPGVVVRK